MPRANRYTPGQCVATMYGKRCSLPDDHPGFHRSYGDRNNACCPPGFSDPDCSCRDTEEWA